MVTCVICGRGEMSEQRRPKVVERDGRVAVIRDVPMLVCDACGEVYLDTEVAKQLDVLFRHLLEGPVDQVVGHFERSAVA
ncbi:MAG: type II toxin-antitoxin system MqsA family antitoxin [Acidimicrobiales bacterium]